MRASVRFGAVLACLCVPAIVGAYTAQTPKWPGSVKGFVKVSGEFSTGAPLALDRDVGACGKEIPDDSIAVGAEGRLQNVIVFLEGIETGKELPRRQLTMDARNCRLGPRVMSMTLGDELTVGSVDSVLHQLHVDVQGADGKSLRAPANQALPPGPGRLKVKPWQPGWVAFRGVHAHPWMIATVRVFDHPYHVVTGADGSFDLTGVPAGKYTLKAWHERFGEVTRNVEVVAGYPSRVELEFGAQQQK